MSFLFARSIIGEKGREISPPVVGFKSHRARQQIKQLHNPKNPEEQTNNYHNGRGGGADPLEGFRGSNLNPNMKK